MKKYGFSLFIFLSIAIIILGLIFLLLDKKAFVPGFVNDTQENWIWNGWAIMLVGLGMLLFGFFIKWIIRREQSDNQQTIDLPPLEFVDDTTSISHRPDKNTYIVKLDQKKSRKKL